MVAPSPILRNAPAEKDALRLGKGVPEGPG